MAELLPCPFCGGEAGLRELRNGDFICECKKCYGKAHRSDSEELAIRRWNTRKPMERIIERYTEMMPIQFNGFGKTLITLEDAINVVKEEGGIE